MNYSCLVEGIAKFFKAIPGIQRRHILLGMQDNVFAFGELETFGNQIVCNPLTSKIFIDDYTANAGGDALIDRITFFSTYHPGVTDHLVTHLGPHVVRARVSIPRIKFFFVALLLDKKDVGAKLRELEYIVSRALTKAL